MSELNHPKRYGLARVLSKLGLCSRSRAEQWIREGRVAVAGRTVRDPEAPTLLSERNITIDGKALAEPARRYLALNKPRGIIVSAADERGRDTVYSLLESAGAAWLAPVGRLDGASEGLLLITNDSSWAARITAPETHVAKVYHVQINGIPNDEVLRAMHFGVEDQGERLAVAAASVLRAGEKHAWLEITLDEGRNRHLRRLLAALGYEVLRLVRVSIGPIALGTLAKGQWRELTAEELAAINALIAA